jgi:hypothetical protein
LKQLLSAMTGVLEDPSALKDGEKDGEANHVEEKSSEMLETEEEIERFKKMERACLRKLDLCIAPLMGAFNFIVRMSPMSLACG